MMACDMTEILFMTSPIILVGWIGWAFVFSFSSFPFYAWFMYFNE